MLKELQIKNNQIKLLAVGIPLEQNFNLPTQPLPLAYSESAFKKLEIGTVTLLDLYQIQPELMKKVLPQLWQLLPSETAQENSEFLANNSNVNIEFILSKIGHWKVKTTDLTGISNLKVF